MACARDVVVPTVYNVLLGLERKNKCALIVDGDPLVLAVIEEIVQECGFDTVSTSRGEEAVVLLAQRPDLVLVVTDVNMPEVTGLDVFHAARQYRADMPVVYVTAYIPDAIHRFVLADEPAAVVEKTFSFDKLRAAITSVL